MTNLDHERVLREMAAMLQRRRLSDSAGFLLDVVEPVAFLASQVAIFARPLTPRGRWHDYVAALGDEQSWRELQRIIKQREC